MCEDDQTIEDQLSVTYSQKLSIGIEWEAEPDLPPPPHESHSIDECTGLTGAHITGYLTTRSTAQRLPVLGRRKKKKKKTKKKMWKS